MRFSRNNVFSTGTHDYTETTRSILLQLKPSILHINSFRVNLDRVEILIFINFFCKKTVKKIDFLKILFATFHRIVIYQKIYLS